MLHFVGELVVDQIVWFDGDFQKKISGQDWSFSDTTPAVDYTTSQNSDQPGTLATSLPEVQATLPGTAQSFLDDILGIVRIAYQSVCQAVECRGMFVDQADKISPRKRHPLPLPVPQVSVPKKPANFVNRTFTSAPHCTTIKPVQR